jgi:hypothetical protein
MRDRDRAQRLEMSPRGGRGSAASKVQKERLAIPHFALPRVSRRSCRFPRRTCHYSSRLPYIAHSLRHVFQTRVDAFPAILDFSHRTVLWSLFSPPRVSQQPSLGRGPRVLRVPYPPHAVVVALDATLSPRACRGMLLDSYGGCRPRQSRVSPPYVSSASPPNHPPADLMPTRPAPHTHSPRMASSASLPTILSPSPPT